MSELKSGGLCLAGDDQVKRIWLGHFNNTHVCVSHNHEEKFLKNELFDTFSWGVCIPIPEEEYQARISFNDGTYELTAKYFTEKEFEEFGFPNSCSLEQRTKRIRK